jgi:uncharacterized membrane protein
MSGALEALTVAAAIGSGVVAGVFFAFSTFVMAALRRLPAAQGIAAMQSINVTAPQPPLMVLMFGTGLACVVAAAIDGSSWLIAGAAVYVLGELAVTIAYNVPRNDELARMDAGSAAAAERWPAWTAEWVAGNHVRTVAGIVAAALLLQAAP